MGKIVYTTSKGIPHESFEKDFLCHKKLSEWWCLTGYLEDDNNNLFSFHSGLLKMKFLAKTFYMKFDTIFDFNTKKTYFFSKFSLSKGRFTVTPNLIQYSKTGNLRFAPNPYSAKGKMSLYIKGKNFELDADLDAVKTPSWQCDDGYLTMGVLDESNTQTFYYSYTNLTAGGLLKLDDNEYRVNGKCWLDRQGGKIKITNPQVHWEKFNIQFFDNTEIMLFYFPHTLYRDGTYIDEKGKYKRYLDYKIESINEITIDKKVFSYSWKLNLNQQKMGKYTILPMGEGKYNFFFYELLCMVVTESGEVCGYCFAELLPGARSNKINIWRALFPHRDKADQE